MAEKELKSIVHQIHALKPSNIQTAPQLLSRAKLSLLKLNALIPSEDSSPEHLTQAREVLELGAFVSIRLRDTEAFTRYYQQLQPFYALTSRSKRHSNESKVTGLYLLLLLSMGDYAGFHTVLEGLEMGHEVKQSVGENEFIQYPVRLEQALMEGSYDKVWSEMKGDKAPSEEFGIFSEVCSRALVVSKVCAC
jgi:26S proteasome regulatory subunit N12